jgi:hypothetical protein
LVTKEEGNNKEVNKKARQRELIFDVVPFVGPLFCN